MPASLCIINHSPAEGWLSCLQDAKMLAVQILENILVLNDCEDLQTFSFRKYLELKRRRSQRKRRKKSWVTLKHTLNTCL